MINESTQHVKPGAPDTSSPEFVYEMAMFASAFVRWAERGCDPDSGANSSSRLHLLVVLSWKGPQIMSKVSQELGVTPRTVTATVDALEQIGMVRRTPHPTDRRATILEIQDSAKEQAAQMMRTAAGKVGVIFDELSEEEKVQLVSILGKLSGRIDLELSRLQG